MHSYYTVLCRWQLEHYFRYAIQLTEEEVLSEIKTYIPQMLTWIGQHTQHQRKKTPVPKWYIYICCMVYELEALLVLTIYFSTFSLLTHCEK